MSKSNKYGYVGVDIPEQSFGNNKGIFNPAEINELVADNKWTQYGQLELIETQTISSGSSSVDFTDIKQDIYNIHFITAQDIYLSTSAHANFRVSNDNGSTFENSNYGHSLKYGATDGTTAENKSATGTEIPYLITSDNNNADHNQGAYMYLYSAGDSTKYTYLNAHSFAFNTINSLNYYQFGGGVYKVEETVNAFQFYASSGTFSGGKISLYGYRTYK